MALRASTLCADSGFLCGWTNIACGRKNPDRQPCSFFHFLDFTLAVEYRKTTTKTYEAKGVSPPLQAAGTEICVRFQMLLNVRNPEFSFVLTVGYLSEDVLDKDVFQRYVPYMISTDNFVARWENVSLDISLDGGDHTEYLIVFSVSLAQGARGFFVALDNMKVTNGACSVSHVCKLVKDRIRKPFV